MSRTPRQPRLSNHIDRNPFDLSQHQTFSLAGGQVTPVQVFEALPGDHFKIHHNTFARCRTLQTAAFARMDLYTDYFFVPYRFLWSYWDAFLLQMPLQDIGNSSTFQSSAVMDTAHWQYNTANAKSQTMTTTPRLRLSQFLRPFACRYTFNKNQLQITNFPQHTYGSTAIPDWTTAKLANPRLLFNSATTTETTDVYLADDAGAPLIVSICKLLDMLGYGSYMDLMSAAFNGFGTSASPADVYVNPFRLLAYYAICEEYFRNDDYDYRLPYCFNVDGLQSAPTSSLPQNMSFTISHPANLLGVELPAAITGATGAVSSTAAPGALFAKLATRLGIRRPLYSKDRYNDYTPTINYDRTVQSVYTSLGLPAGNNMGMNYNNNQLYTDSNEANRDNNNVYARGYVGALVSNGSVTTSPAVASTTGGNGFILGAAVPGATTGSLVSNDYSTQFTQTNTAITGAAVINISPSAINNALALQKMLEITRRARKTASSQYQSHYGTNVRTNETHVVRIGSTSQPIMIDEVVATADSGNTNSTLLGQIGGKGLTNSHGNFTFNSDDFGIIMGVSYVVPRAEYRNHYIDKHNTKFAPTDFFQPEADRLGKQPILAINTPFWQQLAGNQTYGTAAVLPYSNYNAIIGWENRYQEYKTNADVNHFGFADIKSSLANYTIAKGYTSLYKTQGVNTTYPALLSQRENLYVAPLDFNSVFAVEYDGTPDTDQFDCSQQVDCTVVRNMSLTGDMPLNL